MVKGTENGNTTVSKVSFTHKVLRSSHLQPRRSTLHTGPRFRWPRKLHLCVFTRHMQKRTTTWKYHPMCQENFARFNPPHSKRNKNGDRQKKWYRCCVSAYERCFDSSTFRRLGLLPAGLMLVCKSCTLEVTRTLLMQKVTLPARMYTQIYNFPCLAASTFLCK